MRDGRLILLAQVVAFWPVLVWYRLRLGDGSDEPWGILALGAALFFLWQARGRYEWRVTAAPALFLLGYIVSYDFLPPIGRAAVAALAFLTLITPAFCGRLFHTGLWSLVFLSLPIVQSFQYCFGYPFRVATAELTSLALRFGGLHVVRDGAMLDFQSRLIWVDAPCSGMKMIWVGSFFTAILLCSGNLRGGRAAALGAVSFGAMFFANVIRATFLFFLEAFFPAYPHFAHGAIGVLCFAAMAGAVYFVRSSLESEREEATPPVRAGSRAVFAATLALAALAAFAPKLSPEPLFADATETEIHWPQTWRNEPLSELPLTEKERFFSRDFPGAIKRYRTGRGELIVRRVNQSTRKLHPASDCLRASGFEVTPLPAELIDGALWSCSRTEKGETRLKVCELIQDERGKHWADASAWYWSTMWERTPGPFWAFTVSEPIRP